MTPLDGDAFLTSQIKDSPSFLRAASNGKLPRELQAQRLFLYFLPARPGSLKPQLGRVVAAAYFI